MKLRTLKFVAAVMAVLLFALCAVSCSEDDDESLNNSATASNGDVTGCLLPDKNWGGETVTVLAFGDQSNPGYHISQWAPEELTDEPVNDATYERNALIKDKYGINIAVLYRDGYDKITDAIASEVNTTLGDFDIAAGAVHYLAMASASQGMLYDLNTINDYVGDEYLDLSQKWWDQPARRDLSIANSLFYATGDICVTDDTSTWAVYFNKDIVSDKGMEDLFQVVRDQKWTLDKMHSLAKEAVTLSGNQMDFTDDTDDTWGLMATTYDAVAAMLGAGQPMTMKDENDIPQFRITSGANLNAFSKVFDLLTDASCTAVADYFGAWNSGVYETATNIFTNGHSLFYFSSLGDVDSQAMREADIHYGILPMPKSDENMEGYSSSATIYHLTVVSVPISVVDKLPVTTFAMEAMAYYGSQMVKDEYYEVTLKNKRFTDNDSPEMLDIITNNRTYELSMIHDWGQALYLYTNQLLGRTNTLQSSADAAKAAMEEARDATVEAINSLK